jgi:hypothetical protein
MSWKGSLKILRTPQNIIYSSIQFPWYEKQIKEKKYTNNLRQVIFCSPIMQTR